MAIPAESGTTLPVSRLIEDTRALVQGGRFDRINKLQGDLTTSDSTLTLAYTPDLAQGDVLAVGLELLLVWAVNESARTVTVERGMFGSTAAVHTSGDLVWVNPRFSDFHIFNALNNDLSSLSAEGIYQVLTETVTMVGGTFSYELPVELLGNRLLDCRYQIPGASTELWHRISGYEVVRNVDGTTVLQLGRCIPPDGAVMHLSYKAPLTQYAALTDDAAEASGLSTEAIDLPPLGAAVRLLASQPPRRAQLGAQGDSRRPTEVSTGDTLQSAAAIRQLRMQRIAEERRRLSEQTTVRWRDR